MIYPKFLQRGAHIGVTAPARGIKPDAKADFERSIEFIRSQGYRVTLTDNVFGKCKIPSSPADVRVAELLSLLETPDVDAIWAATGGGMCVEMLERLDFEKFTANPKWLVGFSDVTNLVLPITLLCDVATVYGPMAGAFSLAHPHPMTTSTFSVLAGTPPVQYSSEMFELDRTKRGEDLHLDTPTKWVAPNGDFTVSGRMLSSSVDSAMFLVGTKFAPVHRFIEKYGKEGIIWNFDNYILTSEYLYYALWNMKNAGWFEKASAVMISRPRHPAETDGFTYVEAARAALGDIPLVLDTDTGHVPPMFPLVNGAATQLCVKDGAGFVQQTFC